MLGRGDLLVEFYEFFASPLFRPHASIRREPVRRRPEKPCHDGAGYTWTSYRLGRCDAWPARVEDKTLDSPHGLFEGRLPRLIRHGRVDRLNAWASAQTGSSGPDPVVSAKLPIPGDTGIPIRQANNNLA
jgi:hypothetical protein